MSDAQSGSDCWRIYDGEKCFKFSTAVNPDQQDLLRHDSFIPPRSSCVFVRLTSDNVCSDPNALVVEDVYLSSNHFRFVWDDVVVTSVV